METVRAPAVYSLIIIISIHGGFGENNRLDSCNPAAVVTDQFYDHHTVISLLVVAGSQ